jgi:transposase
MNHSMKNKTKTLNAVIGIDLGDKKHHICVTNKNGKILKEFSIPNTRNHLIALASDYPKALVALEVGTHSPWISRLLMTQKMQVIVANARKVRAIYTNDRKSDLIDARMLAKLVRVDPDLLCPIRHGSEQTQKVFLVIKLRDSLVRHRGQIIVTIRGMLKSVGIRLPSTSTISFHKRAAKLLAEHPDVLPAIQPALCALEELGEQIKGYDHQIAQAAKVDYPQAMRLRQIPSIGPITSLAFVLAIEDPDRFANNPRDVGAYLGLIPRRDQSGDIDKALPITKSGNAYIRRLLVQSAQYLLGHFGQDCTLRQQGLKLAAKGGKAAKKKATIAVARKLAVLMVVMWQKQSDFEPFPGQKKSCEIVEEADKCVA